MKDYRTLQKQIIKCYTAIAATVIILILFIIKIIAPLEGRITELENREAVKTFIYKTSIEETIIEEEKEKLKGVKENKYSITNEEKDNLIRVVAAESRGEPLKGQIAVAQVILDRWLEQGTDISDILFSPKQFAAPYTGDITEYPDTTIAVHLVFDEGYRVYEEPTLFFFNPITAEPKQVELLRKFPLIGVIGSHEFRGKN